MIHVGLRMFSAVAVVVLAVLSAGCTGRGGSAAVEVLWDEFGVPHIYASDEAALAYGLGWAQMAAHGNLILRLYAQARGEGAEHLGAAFLEEDRRMHTVGVPRLSQEWYAAQEPGFRSVLDGFADGLNTWAEAHPGEVHPALRGVLPLTGTDVLAHGLRALHFTFLAGPYSVDPIVELWRTLRPGSNAWAISPQRTRDGNAILMGNPHLPWSDLFLFFETHLIGPRGSLYGATLVGFPSVALGFNEALGWTHTVNTYDGVDLYSLTTTGPDDDSYILDGAVIPFEIEEVMIGVRERDGTIRREPHTVRRSIHGPVMKTRTHGAVAMRVAALDRHGAMQQWWDMGWAASLEEFESILQRLQIPMFNILYADREGNILQLFNAAVPRRSHGDWRAWRAPVDGSVGAYVWSEYLNYGELPLVVNPETGWLQNANEPPWEMTLPSPLDRSDYVPYLSASGLNVSSFRSQHSQRMLIENRDLTLEQVEELKFSSRSEVAERIVDELVAVARLRGTPRSIEAARVLEEWDRTYDRNSRGAVLFHKWLQFMLEEAYRTVRRAGTTLESYLEAPAVEEVIFRVPYDPDAPLFSTPRGLRNPEAAAERLEFVAIDLEDAAGALDVPWGEVARMRVGEHDLPASGGSGFETFRVLTMVPAPDGRLHVAHGDSFVFAVEFTATGPRARALLVYGNATRNGKPFLGKQLELYASARLRPVRMSREDVEAGAVETVRLEHAARKEGKP